MTVEELKAQTPQELQDRVLAKLKKTIWRRTCQECGNIQTDVEPTKEPNDAYSYRACNKCGSESLDYGSARQMLKFEPDEQAFMDKYHDCDDYM